MKRDLVIIREAPYARVEFWSNGRRVQRNITQKELQLVYSHYDDENWIDIFCYGIV